MLQRLRNKISHIISQNNSSTLLMNSSYSDDLEYPKFCLSASSHDLIFKTFRQNDIYNKIVELLSETQGQEFLNEIKLNPNIVLEIESFKENDNFGSPRVYNYPSVGKISPTTLMYIKILYDLEKLFGKLDGFDIVEVGVGYGGQSRIINEKFNINSYTLFDLKETLLLSEKFLSKFKNFEKNKFQSIEDYPLKQHDLFISNFAFTELRRDIQEIYMNKLILNSKRGFLIYNDITPEEFNSYQLGELLKMIPNSRVIAEKPLTSSKNCIIIWGENI